MYLCITDDRRSRRRSNGLHKKEPYLSLPKLTQTPCPSYSRPATPPEPPPYPSQSVADSQSKICRYQYHIVVLVLTLSELN